MTTTASNTPAPLSWPQILLAVLTTVPGIVAKVEASDPGLPGEDKKLQVMAEIKTALVEAEPLVGEFLASQPEIMVGFSVAVDTAVDLYNRSAALLMGNVLAATGPTVPTSFLAIGTGGSPIPPAPTSNAGQGPTTSVKPTGGIPPANTPPRTGA